MSIVRLLVRGVVEPLKMFNGGYSRGDIVIVAPGGHVWGAKQCLPNWYQIDVETNRTYGQVMEYREPERILVTPETWNEELQVTDPAQYRTEAKRIWTINFSGIPQAAKDKLALTGQVLITGAQLKPHLRHIRTDAEAVL